MENNSLIPAVVDWGNMKRNLESCSLMIVAAGFEARALNFFNCGWDQHVKNLLVIKYASAPSENQKAFDKVYDKITKNKKRNQKVSYVNLDTAVPQNFESELEQELTKINLPNYGTIWLDISGIPTYAICIALKVCRQNFPLMEMNIIYTEAEEYFPTEEEYRKYMSKYGERGIERLPDSLTSEMSENLILDSFSGFTIRKDPICLILYAGYEKHRALGVIENINPNKIVIIYGKPGRIDLQWRLEMSKHLHANLINERIRSEEVASTLNVEENCRLLIQYYEMLYDDHNICISPVNSKMQTVATYLVWEMFRDIQLVFPLPIKYLPKRFSSKVGKTYSLRLPFSESASIINQVGMR